MRLVFKYLVDDHTQITLKVLILYLKRTYMASYVCLIFFVQQAFNTTTPR